MATSEVLLEKLGTAVGESVPVIIENYTVWHAASAFGWLAIGVALVVFAWRWKGSQKTEKDFADLFNPAELIAVTRAAALVIGLLMVGSNLGDLVSPKAAAIHQLVKDVRGS